VLQLGVSSPAWPPCPLCAWPSSCFISMLLLLHPFMWPCCTTPLWSCSLSPSLPAVCLCRPTAVLVMDADDAEEGSSGETLMATGERPSGWLLRPSSWPEEESGEY